MESYLARPIWIATCYHITIVPCFRREGPAERIEEGITLKDFVSDLLACLTGKQNKGYLPHVLA